MTHRSSQPPAPPSWKCVHECMHTAMPSFSCGWELRLCSLILAYLLWDRASLWDSPDPIKSLLTSGAVRAPRLRCGHPAPPLHATKHTTLRLTGLCPPSGLDPPNGLGGRAKSQQAQGHNLEPTWPQPCHQRTGPHTKSWPGPGQVDGRLREGFGGKFK